VQVSELKMLLDALASAAPHAKEMFLLWVLADKVLAPLLVAIIAGAAVLAVFKVTQARYRLDAASRSREIDAQKNEQCLVEVASILGAFATAPLHGADRLRVVEAARDLRRKTTPKT
jgi:hypothetical protein